MSICSNCGKSFPDEYKRGVDKVGLHLNVTSKDGGWTSGKPTEDEFYFCGEVCRDCYDQVTAEFWKFINRFKGLAKRRETAWLKRSQFNPLLFKMF